MLGPRNADATEQLDAAIARFALAHATVQLNGLDDLVADGVHETERAHRFLEHVTDHPAANRAHGSTVGAERHQVQLTSITLQHDLAAHDPPGLGDDPQDRVRGNALAAA